MKLFLLRTEKKSNVGVLWFRFFFSCRISFWIGMAAIFSTKFKPPIFSRSLQCLASFRVSVTNKTFPLSSLLSRLLSRLFHTRQINKKININLSKLFIVYLRCFAVPFLSPHYYHEMNLKSIRRDR